MMDASFASGSSAVAATERALARIADRDGSVQAWVHVDDEGARGQARAFEAGPSVLPLTGLTLGVKDIIDVGGLPCECGSPIFKGRHAFIDAVLVAKLKALGMVVVGKTATAEFAYLQPPATRNPLDVERSPAGSSSGSAAAVADGHVDAALGTQTAGSIIRPAAFCGVVGFKPSYNRFSRAGVLSVSPALDTVGWLARDVRVATRLWEALTEPVAPSDDSRLGFCRTVHWPLAEPAMRRAFEALVSALAIAEVVAPPSELDDVHAIIMRYEMREELGTQMLQARHLLSAGLRDYLEGPPIADDDYRAALDVRKGYDTDALFAGFDVIMTPAARGEAVPYGSTGDPCFNRFVTLLGLPSVTLPFATGDASLPLGLQLFARRGGDAALLRTAASLEERLRFRSGKERLRGSH